MNARKTNISPMIINNKILPSNLEAERNLIVACIGDPSCVDRALKIIQPGDFYRRGFRKLFEKFCAFREQGRTYTPTLILQSFEDDEDFAAVENFILDETQNFITGQVANHFGSIILDLSIKRKTIGIAENAIERSFNAGFDSRTNLTTLIGDARQLQTRCKGAC